MPYEITYLDEVGGIITTYWGTIEDSDIIKSGQEKLLSLERLRSFRYSITDLSRVENFNLTSEGIQHNVDITAEIIKGNDGIIVAFVLPSDVEYGMGRMWQSYGDTYGISSYVCRSRTEAEAWIRKNVKQQA